MKIKDKIRVVKHFIWYFSKTEKMKFSMCLITVISFFIFILFLKLSIIKLCVIFSVSIFILFYALFKAAEINFIKRMAQLEFVKTSYQIAISENPPSQKEIETMVNEFFNSYETWILKKAVIGCVHIANIVLQRLLEHKNETILNQNEVDFFQKLVTDRLKTSKKFRSEDEK